MLETSRAETEIVPTVSTAPPSSALGADWTRYLAFGTSVGMAIGDSHLEVALVRARPNGITVAAQATISDYRRRTPAEWGREFRDFLIKNGEKHLSATILLPRREVIVRLASVPGVQKKDIPAALASTCTGRGISRRASINSSTFWRVARVREGCWVKYSSRVCGPERV